MPFLIILLIFVSTTYQLFFRFEHWNDRSDTHLVYERDNLTGETHMIHPGDQISFIQRITGKFPPNNYVKNPPSGPESRSTVAYQNTPTSPESRHQISLAPANAPIPIRELSLPPEPINALATAEIPPITTPRPSLQPETNPPEPVMALVSHAATTPQKNEPLNEIASQHTSPLPTVETKKSVYQHEKKLDLNRDGRAEKITLHRSEADGLLDISIIQDQRELFYGRGESLQILAHQNHGWSDVALVLPNEPNQIFEYNATKQSYEMVPHS